MRTATDAVGLPDVSITLNEFPTSAPFPAEAVPETRADTEDHINPKSTDASWAKTSRSKPVATTLTADAINGDCDGVFTHTPVSLTKANKKIVDAPARSVTPEDDFSSPATRLRHRLVSTKDLIVCPGVYDGFSARIALSVGFDAMYMVWFAYWSLHEYSKMRSRLMIS